ncbi:MAG: hypothetical protein ACI9MC_004064 [Kiritimatiellia bacterium]
MTAAHFCPKPRDDAPTPVVHSNSRVRSHSCLMTPLRQKVLDDLRLIGRSKQTQAAYTCFISRFARHYQRCPSKLGTEHVRQFFLHLRRTGRKPQTLKSYHAALRFLYNIVLDRPDVMAGVPKPKVPRRDALPALTRQDVRSLLHAANTPLKVDGQLLKNQVPVQFWVCLLLARSVDSEPQQLEHCGVVGEHPRLRRLSELSI